MNNQTTTNSSNSSTTSYSTNSTETSSIYPACTENLTPWTTILTLTLLYFIAILWFCKRLEIFLIWENFRKIKKNFFSNF